LSAWEWEAYTRAPINCVIQTTAGFVFIEPSHEDTFIVPLGGNPTPLWAVSPEQARAIAASLNASPRPPPPLSSGPPFDRLPPEILRTRLAFEKRALVLSSAEDELIEFESRRAIAARLHTAGQALGSRPVIVLTAEHGASGLSRDVQAKVGALSENSAHRVVPSEHFIHLHEPSFVVRAIADVVSAVRNKAKVTP